MGIFGYLAEFWNQIAEATVSAGTYTVEWFQNIGNAVAGAVGPIILEPAKLFVDLALAVGYILQSLWSIVVMIFGFFKFLTDIVLDVFTVLVISPVSDSQFTFNQQTLDFFKSFPLMSTLLLVLGVLIVFVGVFKIIKDLGKTL